MRWGLWGWGWLLEVSDGDCTTAYLGLAGSVCALVQGDTGGGCAGEPVRSWCTAELRLGEGSWERPCSNTLCGQGRCPAVFLVP